MPNWCLTDYTIVGERKDVEKIYNAVINTPVKEQFDLWESQILDALGVHYDKETYNLRGYILNADIEHKKDWSKLDMTFHEAWERTEFAEKLQEHFPGIGIYWIAEEPGLAIYETNDEEKRFYSDRFCVDTCINGQYSKDYFETKEAAFEWLNKISGCKNDEDVEKFNAQVWGDSDDFIFVHEFKVV